MQDVRNQSNKTSRISTTRWLGRPPTISDESILRIIAVIGEVSQYRIREITKMKKSTLSMRIKKLRALGLIKTRTERRGRNTFSLVLLVRL